MAPNVMTGYAPPPETPPPKKGGIDYSKFDKIEDSDDEKPEKPSEKPPAAEEKPHCHNCHKDIQKPLRCGVCKKVSYCSAACQKDDWSFHKRNCKKPEEKAKAAPKKPAKSPENEKEKEKRQKEEKVMDDEDVGTWYRHREWKPTAEPKKDFAPTRLEAEASASSKPAAAGSAWNAAGTWEEKDVTDFAKNGLAEALRSFQDVEAAGGVLCIKDVEKVEGEASKPVIRGKMRHIFDLNFKVQFEFKWMDSSGQKQAQGNISISDFTNDTFAEGVLAEPAVDLSFREARLEPSRRQAVQAALGTSWPPAEKTLMAQVAEKMKSWSQDFEKAT
ncbi:unnamed protein product [Effrenium voratum]|uniref:MYND-type domain-containing protein n=2 Tax=Effrenium voratum TaxID=2562239 RepID=A0AA36J8U4_9DINO|nr:unnamed protein product [Effrenium voratum]